MRKYEETFDNPGKIEKLMIVMNKEIEKLKTIKNNSSIGYLKDIMVMLQENNVKYMLFKETIEVISHVFDKYVGKKFTTDSETRIINEITQTFNNMVTVEIQYSPFCDFTIISISFRNDDNEKYSVDIRPIYTYPLINCTRSICSVPLDKFEVSDIAGYTKNVERTASKISSLYKKFLLKENEIRELNHDMNKLSNGGIMDIRSNGLLRNLKESEEF